MCTLLSRILAGSSVKSFTANLAIIIIIIIIIIINRGHLITSPDKTLVVDVDLEGIHPGDEHVNAEVKLAASETETEQIEYCQCIDCYLMR